MSMSKHIVPFANKVTRDERTRLNRNQGAVVWFTGLPASGKSTTAAALERTLFDQGHQVFLLDGDHVRTGLNRDLGFTPEDRKENIRRLSEVSKLMAEAGMIVLVAAVSPYQQERQCARMTSFPIPFLEVYVHCPVEECVRRDPKNHYKKAISGEIAHFTGISAPYEEPEQPDAVINTAGSTVPNNVEILIALLRSRSII